MPFDQMQDLLNALQESFKVFVYAKEKEIILRVFIDIPVKGTDYTDICYNLSGEYLRNS